jgi:ABC-type multidrug transport system fused ATPase/permease subunit
MAGGILSGFFFGIWAVLYYLLAGDTTESRVRKEEEIRARIQRERQGIKTIESNNSPVSSANSANSKKQRLAILRWLVALPAAQVVGWVVAVLFIWLISAVPAVAPVTGALGSIVLGFTYVLAGAYIAPAFRLRASLVFLALLAMESFLTSGSSLFHNVLRVLGGLAAVATVKGGLPLSPRHRKSSRDEAIALPRPAPHEAARPHRPLQSEQHVAVCASTGRVRRSDRL